MTEVIFTLLNVLSAVSIGYLYLRMLYSVKETESLALRLEKENKQERELYLQAILNWHRSQRVLLETLLTTTEDDNEPKVKEILGKLSGHVEAIAFIKTTYPEASTL